MCIISQTIYSVNLLTVAKQQNYSANDSPDDRKLNTTENKNSNLYNNIGKIKKFQQTI